MPIFWQMTNIPPIFQKGNKLLRNKYRSISLTCVPGKIMERLVHDEAFYYMQINNLFDQNQHFTRIGFCKGKSCETNLIESIDLITESMESHLEVVLILLDFAKAFDKVSNHL